MAGFGSFMEGLQGGIGTGQDIRRQRQLDQIYDQEITLGGEKVTGRDHSRARAGLPPLKKFLSGDPVLFRIMDKLGRGTGATESPTASALPTPGEAETPPVALSGEYGVEMPEQDFSQIEEPKYEFADGTNGGLGDWLDDEKAGKPKRNAYDPKADIQSRADANKAARKAGAAPREAVPTQVVDRSAEKTLGQKIATKAGAAKSYATRYDGYGLAAKEGAGMASKAGRFLGRVAAPLAIAGAGAGGIRGAMDAPQPGDSILGDTWERAKGAGKGVVAGLLNPMDAIMGPGEEEAAPAPQEEAIPTGSSGPRGPRRYPGQGGARTAALAAPAAAAPEAVPTQAAPADPLEGFDVSKVPAEEIPNFSNKDWESFREENIKELVANGMSYAEAWDKVDQQTVATQQRGFMHFAKQAFTAMGPDGKYSPAAASAVRAAFQYLPSTTDIQVGNYNGHLVAFSIDEDTGEQVGQPMVITPDMLQKVMLNFQSPAVWAEYAQDNRKLDMADRELDQGDRRLDLMDKGLGIERENAVSNRLRAMGGSGSGTGEDGMKLSDADRHTQFWQDQSYAAAGKDPELQAAMAAVMSSLYAEDGGQTRPEVIARQVTGIANTPEGRAKILAAANQYAGG